MKTKEIPPIFKEIFEDIPLIILPLFYEAKNLWDPLDRLQDFIKEQMHPKNQAVIKGNVYIEGDVQVGEGTVIEHGAVIKGPVIIGKNCEIRAGAYIRGNVIIGDHSVVGHDTEIIRSILFDRVQASHFNYIGDSILGNHAHMGAGAKIANLRFDQKNIVLDGKDTGRRKFGAILGDHVQIAVNVSVGPGVILEKGTWILSKDQLTSGIYRRENLPFNKK